MKSISKSTYSNFLRNCPTNKLGPTLERWATQERGTMLGDDEFEVNVRYDIGGGKEQIVTEKVILYTDVDGTKYIYRATRYA